MTKHEIYALGFGEGSAEVTALRAALKAPTTEPKPMREGAEQHLCGHCGAQYMLMGAHYLEQMSEVLDAVGAPKKSADGNIHLSMFDRIRALKPNPDAVQVGERVVFDALAKLHDALVLAFNYAPNETIEHFAKRTPFFDAAGKLLHSMQEVALSTTPTMSADQ